MLVVGPESSQAFPGPVCYKKGGMLSITDANVLLGRVQPTYFPKLFGPNNDEELGLEEARKAFEALKSEIQGENPDFQTGLEELAFGFVKVANE